MTNEMKLNTTVSEQKLKAPKKRGSASLDKRKARSGYFFVLPFLIGFIAIYLPMIWDSIVYSFSHVTIVAGEGSVTEFVGWENYNEALFVNPDFIKTLVTGIKELAFDIPAIILFSLFMAVLLNQKMAGRAAFRAILFVPVIISTGLMESIASQNIMDDMGEEGIADGTEVSTASEIVSAIDIENLFAGMKVGTELVEYVVTMINNIYDIVNRSGVQMLIFLSGLQGISPAIYESCSIEGASPWETFWKITLPMISPMILVNAVYTIIDSFTSSSNKVMSYVAEVTSQVGNGNVLGSAMSWMYFIVVILIVAAIAAIMSAFVFYQRKE